METGTMSICPTCFEFQCACPKRTKTVKGKDGVIRTNEIDAFGNPVKRGAGRGPTGGYRNFGAMTDTKLIECIEAMETEDPVDTEAMLRAETEWDKRVDARRNPTQHGPKPAPYFVWEGKKVDMDHKDTY